MRKLNNYDDPTGVAAAIVVITTVLAGIVGVTVDSEIVERVAGIVAGVVNLLAILRARGWAWAPASVDELVVDSEAQVEVLRDELYEAQRQLAQYGEG